MDLTVYYNYVIKIRMRFSPTTQKQTKDVTPSPYSGSDQGKSKRGLLLNLARPLPQQ